MIVTQLSVADQISIGTVSSEVWLVLSVRDGRGERDVQMYSEASNPLNATVRTMPHIPALSLLDWFPRMEGLLQTYKTPRLRPHATVIFSLFFILRSQITNHGRIAKQKSAATNHARQFGMSAFIHEIRSEVVLTSNSVSDVGKIEPTRSLGIWIPGPFNWYTLYDNSDAGK